MIDNVQVFLLIFGVIIGAIVTITLSRAQNRILRHTMSLEIENTYKARANAERNRIVRIYEGKIHDLKDQLQKAVATARKDSTNQSRAVLKGKIAEQIAPLLPGFEYWPSDSRFLGDPVDYVVFNGYSSCKDRLEDCHNIEVVILDIKQGKSGLTYGQKQIAQAVAEGRVRFEVVRVHTDGSIRTQSWGTSSNQDQDVATGTYIVRNAEN